MTIRRLDPAAASVGISQRLVENGGRIPFSQVDVKKNGRVSLEEVAQAVRLNFPALSDGEASAIANKAFDAVSKNGKEIGGMAWGKAENVILREAEISLADKAGWVAANGGAGAPMVGGNGSVIMPPPMAGPAYLPRNDAMITGQMPYQYAMQPPADSAGKAATRGVIGFLKMLPVVGNVINGIDFVRDIGKGIATWLNPNKSFGEKLKSGADLLAHGAGMIVPQVGAMYDVSQSALRLGKAALGGNQPTMVALPQWQMNNGGYNNVYQSPNNYQYGNTYNQNTYAQFPNFTRWGQSYQTGMNSNGYGTSAYNIQAGGYRGGGYGQNSGGGVLSGALRTGIGAAKMLPVAGNILNGIDFAVDLGRVAKDVLTLHPLKALKAAADALFHGAGMIVPQVGGAYDMARGVTRMATAGIGNNMGIPSYAQNYYQPNIFNSLPNWGGHQTGMNSTGYY